MLPNMQVKCKYWAILHKGLEYVHIEMSTESLDRSLLWGLWGNYHCGVMGPHLHSE